MGFDTESESASMQNLHYHIAFRNWHYGVVTFEGPAIGLYIDGVPVATKSASACPNSGGEKIMRMGAESQCLNNYFVRKASYYL